MLKRSPGLHVNLEYHQLFLCRICIKIKIQATRSYGAEVVLSPTRDESDTKVLNESNKDVYWLPPFNNKQVIAGQVLQL